MPLHHPEENSAYFTAVDLPHQQLHIKASEVYKITKHIWNICMPQFYVPLSTHYRLARHILHNLAERKLVWVAVTEWGVTKSLLDWKGVCGVLCLFLVTYVLQGDSHSCLAPTSLQLLQQIQASQTAAAAANATANGQPTTASLSALSTMQQQLLVQQQLQAAQNSAGLY